MGQVSPARGGIAGRWPAVLEYRSVGKSRSPNFNLNKSLSLIHYSTSPLIQQTPASRKDPKTPSGGGSKAGPSGPDSLFLTQLGYFSSVFPHFMGFFLEEQGISLNIQGQEPISVAYAFTESGGSGVWEFWSTGVLLNPELAATL